MIIIIIITVIIISLLLSSSHVLFSLQGSSITTLDGLIPIDPNTKQSRSLDARPALEVAVVLVVAVVAVVCSPCCLLPLPNS